MTEIAIEKIRVERNDRTLFNHDALAELAASIEAVGLVQPITVRSDGDGYVLIAGERRLRAHRLLGRTTIAAHVQDRDDAQAAAAMLVENVGREDLNPIDEAHAYAHRLDTFGLTVEELAAQTGVAAFRIRWRLDLLRLCPDAEHLVRAGQLALGPARAVARLDWNRQVIALGRLQRSPNMAFIDFVAMTEGLLCEQDQESMFDTDDVLQTAVWSKPARKARKTSRRDLHRALLAVLDVIDGTSISDARVDSARQLAQIGV